MGSKICRFRKKMKCGSSGGAVGYPEYLFLYWDDYKYRSDGGRGRVDLTTYGYKHGRSPVTHSYIALGEVDFMRKNDSIGPGEKK